MKSLRLACTATLVVILVMGCGGTSATPQNAANTNVATTVVTSSVTAPPASSTPAPPVSQPPATSAAPSAPSVMPNLVGRSYDEAFASLVPYNVQVTRQVRISPQGQGVVIDQTPTGGSSFVKTSH